MRRYLGQIQVSAIPPIGLNKTKRTARSYPPTETPSSEALGVRVGDPASGAGWYRKRNPVRILALPLIVGTLRRASALGVLTMALAGACSLPGAGSSASPAASSSRTSPSAATPSSPLSQSPSPAPVTSAYGVLVSAQSSPNYSVSLVGIDGRVVASAQATTPNSVTCANAAAALVAPPVSISNARVYYMDAQGVIRYLAPNGDAGRSTTVPIGPARRAMFAVSPDDQRIAVIVDDFDATGALTNLP